MNAAAMGALSHAERHVLGPLLLVALADSGGMDRSQIAAGCDGRLRDMPCTNMSYTRAFAHAPLLWQGPLGTLGALI